MLAFGPWDVGDQSHSRSRENICSNLMFVPKYVTPKKFTKLENEPLSLNYSSIMKLQMTPVMNLFSVFE